MCLQHHRVITWLQTLCPRFTCYLVAGWSWPGLHSLTQLLPNGHSVRTLSHHFIYTHLVSVHKPQSLHLRELIQIEFHCKTAAVLNKLNALLGRRQHSLVSFKKNYWLFSSGFKPRLLTKSLVYAPPLLPKLHSVWDHTPCTPSNGVVTASIQYFGWVYTEVSFYTSTSCLLFNDLYLKRPMRCQQTLKGYPLL